MGVKGKGSSFGDNISISRKLGINPTFVSPAHKSIKAETTAKISATFFRFFFFGMGLDRLVFIVIWGPL